MILHIKKLAKYILTFPQVLICRLKGINTPWSDLVTFFRYFPFGKINKENSVDIHYRNHPVKFFYDDLGPMLAGEFAGNDYDKLPVEGVEVLDIGASCGDTPIIFALRGASKVVGYELNERYFNLSRRNVEANNLSKKINLKLSGVAAKKIDSADEILAAIVPERDRSSVGVAEFKTLNEIVIDNRFTSSTVMKMDVDGYEYEIDSIRCWNLLTINIDPTKLLKVSWI